MLGVVRGGGRRAGDDAPRLAIAERSAGSRRLRPWVFKIATNVCIDASRSSPPCVADGPGRTERRARRAGHAVARVVGWSRSRPVAGPETLIRSSRRWTANRSGLRVRRRAPVPGASAASRAHPARRPALARRRGRGAVGHERRCGEQCAAQSPGVARRRSGVRPRCRPRASRRTGGWWSSSARSNASMSRRSSRSSTGTSSSRCRRSPSGCAGGMRSAPGWSRPAVRSCAHGGH